MDMIYGVTCQECCLNPGESKYVTLKCCQCQGAIMTGYIYENDGTADVAVPYAPVILQKRVQTATGSTYEQVGMTFTDENGHFIFGVTPVQESTPDEIVTYIVKTTYHKTV